MKLISGKIVLVLLCALDLGISNLLYAQNFVPVSNENEWRQKLAESSRSIKSIQCDFVQEKSMSLLSDKAISKGRFYFKRENKVRLEYRQPTKNLIVMNEGRLIVQDEKKTTETDTRKNKAFQQLNNIIIGSIDGSLFNSPDFSVRFYESDKAIKIELKPLSKMIKNFLSTVVIILDKKDYTALRIEMNEVSGDNTILLFSNKIINGDVNDTLFVLR